MEAMPVPYNDWLATLTRKADLREKAGLRRSVTPRGPAIDLAGNDYLGLSQHPRVLAAAGSALQTYGLGATGSRLVRGTTSAHATLEAELSSFLGTQSALVYSSGYLANLGAIRALASLSPRTQLISDAHCHASMIDGCRLAGAGVRVFNHADPAHAAALIEPGAPAIILTESVFSVDGDLAPLAALHRAARAAGALLLVDDAHGLGVGSYLDGLAGEPDVIITATLSKTLGGAGGAVCGPAELIRHLVDTSRTFIFDTAPPPAVMAGVLAALDLTRSAEGDALRATLHRRTALLTELGASGAGPAGGVVSLVAQSAESALEWAAACRENGVAVGCFRPPSTPDNRSRLRLTVNASVPEDDFLHALDIIRKCKP
jgi:8-amino-7-oxononanoate synthase